MVRHALTHVLAAYMAAAGMVLCGLGVIVQACKGPDVAYRILVVNGPLLFAISVGFGGLLAWLVNGRKADPVIALSGTGIALVMDVAPNQPAADGPTPSAPGPARPADDEVLRVARALEVAIRGPAADEGAYVEDEPRTLDGEIQLKVDGDLNLLALARAAIAAVRATA